MTVAVIGTRGFPGIQGGVEMHCQNLYTRMPGVNVRVYRRRPYLTTDSDRHYPGVEFVDLPSTRIPGFEVMLHTLLCVCHIALHRPTVVHVHNIGPGLYTPLLRLLGLPVVLTYHSPNYEHAKWGFVARAMLRLGEWLSLRLSRKVIFVNKFQHDKCGELARRKGVCIPNGIDPDVARPCKATTLLRRHGLTPGRYLLAVGRLTPEKGFEYLVQAAQRLPEGFCAVIAGATRNDYYQRLRRLDRDSRVRFVGYVAGDDLAQLYTHARLFALPSVNEGFPLVLLEAMSHGLPLVVSDIPATRLLPLPDEAYCPPANADALADALLRELDREPQRRQYDLTAYDWTAIAAATLDVYRQALPQHTEARQ